MPYQKPTLRTLIDRAQADINARLPGADARLPASNLNVLATMHAGAMHGLYGFLDWIARQCLPDTAESLFLERWAAIWGITRIAAASATGLVTFTGVNGITVPAGTALARADGVQYLTTGAVDIGAGSAVATVTAAVGSVSSNLASGTLSLVTPISGIDPTATIGAGGLSGGADIEADSALRARLLARIRRPPQGGSANDYVTWAKEVAGVTRAWVYPMELGPGTVTVRFVRDNDGTGAAILPDAGEVAAVQAYINERRPVTAVVTVVAPLADVQNITISGLSPNTAAVQAAVTAELADFYSRTAVPGGTELISQIRASISAAADEVDHVLVTPAANVVHTTGRMAVLGTVTFI